MSYRKRKQRRHTHNGRGRIVLVVILGIVASVVIAALAAVGWLIAIANSAPDISKLQPIDKGATSIIYAADGPRRRYLQSDPIRTPIACVDPPAIPRPRRASAGPLRVQSTPRAGPRRAAPQRGPAGHGQEPLHNARPKRCRDGAAARAPPEQHLHAAA